MLRRFWFPMVVAAAALALSGCYARARGGVYATTPAYASSGVVVYEAPPQPRVVVHTPPPAPYPGAVWVRGHWQWNGHSHVWVDGHYMQPRAGYVYVQPRWERRGTGYVYVQGTWRAGGHSHGNVRVRQSHRRHRVHGHGRGNVRVRTAPPPRVRGSGRATVRVR